MTDYVPPCGAPENNPDDWFIEKDGRQYVDDVRLSDQEVALIERTADLGAPYDEGDSWNEAVERLKAERLAEHKRQALIRRRKARDKCHTECYRRLECLGIAMGDPTPATWGTWGGYFPEQLEEIRRLRRERASM